MKAVKITKNEKGYTVNVANQKRGLFLKLNSAQEYAKQEIDLAKEKNYIKACIKNVSF